jgi:hypothetical protein
MLENLIVNKPVIPPAVQYSGGEPTVRERARSRASYPRANTRWQA